MTKEESLTILNQVLVERGYLVVSFATKQEIGTIVRSWIAHGGICHKHPLRVIAETDLADAQQQWRMAGFLGDKNPVYPHHYRAITD